MENKWPTVSLDATATVAKKSDGAFWSTGKRGYVQSSNPMANGRRVW